MIDDYFMNYSILDDELESDDDNESLGVRTEKLIRDIDSDIENLTENEFMDIYGVSTEIAKYQGMTKEEYEELYS
ncbi:hypothetical protein JCM31447_32070 (plasmid) [Fluviispira sanaruensis]|uniref:Uncharacterized protein n=2 Tax=Fluviispira sanaruensis TaxID=2493639 RepID=A0A4P2VMT8_FLUSA|nr:hypothetical protein JCM31447_32070 [Fluviispira sanaruensis]